MKEIVIIISLLAFCLLSVIPSFASDYAYDANVAPFDGGTGIPPEKVPDRSGISTREAFEILAKANPGIGNAMVIFNDSQLE